MKRILILYISNVSGHRSAANAIEKAIRMLSPTTPILSMNFFQYVAPVTEKIVNAMYMEVVKRAPIVWQVMYDNPRVVRSTSRARKFVYAQIRKKVDALISSFSPDVVVTTQAFPCEIVSRYKQETGKRFKVFGVLTDYAPHSFWVSEAVDYYVVPSDEVKHKLVSKGVDEDKVHAFGIPIDPDFCFSKDPERIRASLGIQNGSPLVLVMRGGLGLGPLKERIKTLDKLKDDFQIMVVCGSNKKLFNSIKKLQKKMNHRCYVFGYVDNVDELMTISKILITKSGGLTISEAMAKGLPMVVVDALPGQEYNNLRFLLRNRCCLRAKNGEEMQMAVSRLLNDKKLWEKLHKNALLTGRPNSALETAHLVLEI